jgi:uncharacterized delta-60 repeat protein
MSSQAFKSASLFVLGIILFGIITVCEGESNAQVDTEKRPTTPVVTDQTGSGDLIWAKRAGGSNNDNSIAITTLSDNSTVVTGIFAGSAIFGKDEINQTVLNSAGSFDIFIARYNPDGTLVWAKRAGGSDRDRSKEVTKLFGNSTVVVGFFYGSATFAPGEPNQIVLNSDGDSDIFIARYNLDGKLIWAKRVGGAGHDICSGITTLTDNSTVVIGTFAGTATFGQGEPNQTVLSSAGECDSFIARYNPNGTLAWVKCAGEPNFDVSWAITTLSDNSTVVIGSFYGTATFGSGEPNKTIITSAGGMDIFIARYNPNGTLAWAKSAGGSESDACWAITSLSDNSIVVTGLFNGFAIFGSSELNQTSLTSTGCDDIFIARYNPDGLLEWVKSAGGSGIDNSLAITTLSDNSTTVTGQFKGLATFGQGELNETVLTSDGWLDIFIARYNPNGSLAWVKRAGGPSSYPDCGIGITTLSDNSTVVIGDFRESATFGSGESNETFLTDDGGGDIFIARFAP